MCQPSWGCKERPVAWQGAWLVFSSKKAGAWTGKGREVAASVRRGAVSTSGVVRQWDQPLEPNPVFAWEGCSWLGQAGRLQPWKWACAGGQGQAGRSGVTAVLPQCLGDVPGARTLLPEAERSSSLPAGLPLPVGRSAAHPRPNLRPACRAGRRPRWPCLPWAGTHSPVFSEDDSSETHWGGSWLFTTGLPWPQAIPGSWGRGQLAR